MYASHINKPSLNLYFKQSFKFTIILSRTYTYICYINIHNNLPHTNIDIYNINFNNNLFRTYTYICNINIHNNLPHTNIDIYNININNNLSCTYIYICNINIYNNLPHTNIDIYNITINLPHTNAHTSTAFTIKSSDDERGSLL